MVLHVWKKEVGKIVSVVWLALFHQDFCTLDATNYCKCLIRTQRMKKVANCIPSRSRVPIVFDLSLLRIRAQEVEEEWDRIASFTT